MIYPPKMETACSDLSSLTLQNKPVYQVDLVHHERWREVG